MLLHSRNRSLLHALLPYTISCAHPVASRWKKSRQGNCGYCFPCLMRRAACHGAGWDDGREYLYDALKQPEVLTSRARGPIRAACFIWSVNGAAAQTGATSLADRTDTGQF